MGWSLLPLPPSSSPSLPSSSPSPPPPLTNQDFGGGVVHADGLEDGGSVVGDGHRAALPPTQQDLVLVGEPIR